MTTYFGFAIADSMFPAECTVRRRPLTVDQVRLALPGAVMCLNPSHWPTIAAAIKRFWLPITIPEHAPIVRLCPGDSVIVMSVRGLPRLEGRHEYTEQEIEAAEFVFSQWTVLGHEPPRSASAADRTRAV